MIINLNEISPNGQTYHLSQHNHEIREAIQDLIGSMNFIIDFKIIPISQYYHLTGLLKTTTQEACALCADTVNFPIEEKINEIILVVSSYKKQEKSLKTTQFSHLNDSWNVTELQEPFLDIGEFCHQIIALAQPYQIFCHDDCKGLCTVCGVNKNYNNCSCIPNIEEIHKDYPFTILKDIYMN